MNIFIVFRSGEARCRLWICYILISSFHIFLPYIDQRGSSRDNGFLSATISRNPVLELDKDDLYQVLFGGLWSHESKVSSRCRLSSLFFRPKNAFEPFDTLEPQCTLLHLLLLHTQGFDCSTMAETRFCWHPYRSPSWTLRRSSRGRLRVWWSRL